MKNKKAKQMICDVLNLKFELASRGKFVWVKGESTPRWICSKTSKCLWLKHPVKSLTANQLRGK